MLTAVSCLTAASASSCVDTIMDPRRPTLEIAFKTSQGAPQDDPDYMSLLSLMCGMLGLFLRVSSVALDTDRVVDAFLCVERVALLRNQRMQFEVSRRRVQTIIFLFQHIPHGLGYGILGTPGGLFFITCPENDRILQRQADL